MKATIEKTCISYYLAQTIVSAALNHAKSLDIQICVAITDPLGNLIAFAKMDDCSIIGIGSSQGKAYTAARSGLNTRVFFDFLNTNQVPLDSLQQEKLVLIAGGLPIIYQEKVIGGIGIGGATAAQDEECAKLALETALNGK